MNALIKELTEISEGGNKNEVEHLYQMTNLLDKVIKENPEEAKTQTKMINDSLFKALLKGITTYSLMTPMSNIMCKGQYK